MKNDLGFLAATVEHLKQTKQGKEQAEIAQNTKIQALNKSLGSVEATVKGLNAEFKKMKAEAGGVDEKIAQYGLTQINPLIDEMVNQQKANEILLREFDRK